MSPEEEQRLFDARTAIAESNCEVVVAAALSDVNPSIKQDACDAPVTPPDELFFAPNAPPVEEIDDHVLPRPIVVKGAAFSIDCAAGQISIPEDAPPVSYAAGAITAATQLVYLDSITSIPTGELYRVAGLVDGLGTLVDSDLAALVAAGDSWATFDADVQAALGVLPHVAVDIREALVAAQLRANSVVSTVAAAALRCAWSSRLLRAYCDPTPSSEVGYLLAIPPELPPSGVEAVEAAAGIATSNVSQADADAKAGRIAAQGLTCLFRNEEKTVTCADVEGGEFTASPSLLWPPDADSLRNPQLAALSSLEGEFYVADTLPDTRTLRLVATTPAGSVTGRSQEEADAIALLLATASLGCFFPSRPRIFSCADAGDYGNAAAQRELLNGRPEDDILNEMATGSIAGVRTDNAGIIANVSVDTTVGVYTRLPAGMFVGATSEIAEDLAEAFATATLECLWGNVELTYACDDVNSDTSQPTEVARHRPSTAEFPLRPYQSSLVTANKQGKAVFSSALGQTLNMLASPRKSSPYVVNVIERQFLNEGGQNAANEAAATFAVTQLGCVYCNPRIAPVCALFVTSRPVGVEQPPPYTADNVELPVSALLLAPGQSADATAGVPGVRYSAATSWGPPANYLTDLTEGATFTCGDFDEVVAVVDVVGAIPIRDLVTATPDANCLYGNDRTAAACRSSVTPPDGVATPNFHTPEELEDYENYLSPRSTEGSIVVVENTFREAGESGKATANLMAKAHALSQLNCYFESPQLELYCGATTAPLLDAGSAFPPVGVDFPSAAAFSNPLAAVTIYGNGKSGVVVGGEYVHPRSKGFKQRAVGPTDPDAKPVRLSYGVGKSDVSPKEALLQALFIGLGQLNCYFLNKAKDAACLLAPAPAVTTFAAGANPTAEVAANLYPSVESQAAADEFARLVALASLVCLYTHPDPVEVDVCSPTTRILVSKGIVPAEFTVSAVSSAAALADSTALAASFVVCDRPDSSDGAEFSSPFGVGAGAGGSCCKVNMTPGSLSDLTSLTVCISPAEGTPPQDNLLKDSATALGNPCAADGYFYIEAIVQKTTNGKSPDTEWWGDAINFKILWQAGAVTLHEKVGEIYTIRRVVAEVVAGSEDDCSDTTILQAVSAPQKVTTTLDDNGNKIPIIVDLHAPAGGGGSGTTPTSALTLVTSRPSYIPVGTAVAAGMKGIWVTWGFANERLPTNWHHRLDVPLTGDYTKYIYLKINFATDSDALVVTTCNWETFSFPAVTPPWGANGVRPAFFYFLLGTVTSGGLLPAGVHVVNNGGGSIQVSEYLSRIIQGGATGFTYEKTFSIQRFLT